jgi:hypothetical protein
MKHIFILLSIFTASLICEPVMAEQLGNQTTSELFHIEKKRKFKTHKKKRRGQRTCLKKGGCKKHKLIGSHKSHCNTY